MASHGGKRSNSGRKTKAEKHVGPVTRAEGLICDTLPELVELAFVRARGFTMKDVTESGEVEYYETAPDLKAIIYLIDRVMGKPTERRENKNENTHSFDERFTAALARSYGRPGDYPNGAHPNGDHPRLSAHGHRPGPD